MKCTCQFVSLFMIYARISTLLLHPLLCIQTLLLFVAAMSIKVLLSTFLYFFIISFLLVAQLAWPEATSIIDVGANKGKKILIYCFLLRCTELESNHPAVFMSCLAPNYFSPSD